jgi:hypothetical protein
VKYLRFAVVPAVLLLVQCWFHADDQNPMLVDTESVRMAALDDTHSLRTDDFPGISDPPVIVEALAEAYPGQVFSLGMTNGDWSLVVNGTVLYWADGRLLPEDLRNESQSFTAYSFRPNPAKMPPVRVLSESDKARLKARVERGEADKDARNPLFLNALWGMENFDKAEVTVVRGKFLGKKLRIHPGIQNTLAQVESEILEIAESDTLVSLWIKQLGSTDCYVWREIAGSANRSLHSYGIAIDLIPVSYRGKQAYWRWAKDFYEEWWAVPHEDRHQIPQPVVKIFEDNGFTWGGKWMLFDQIHFEYRPELVILGRMADAK